MTEPITILLIDADQVAIMNVEQALSKCDFNFSMQVANNGEEGLRMLKGKGNSKLNPFPQIILFDINMPKMSGAEFLKELREDADLKFISVYILTTSKDSKDIKDAYNRNVAGYIMKPTNFMELVDSMQHLTNYWKLIQFVK